MEQVSDNKILGPPNIPPGSMSRQIGSGAWGIPSGTDVYHTSRDASLFSCSLPVLPHEKLNFANSEHSGFSADDSSTSLNKTDLENEENSFLEGIEPYAVGNLLPDDEDDLLAGIMDDFDLSGLPNQLEDLEEYDLFGSGGGMELDFDAQDGLSIGLSKISMSDLVASNGIGQYALQNAAGTVTGEHPYGEHPSRTLFVRNINSNVEDSEIVSLFEQYGNIRTLYTACKHRGFVMISYYDIRDARTAMRALQNKPLRRRKLDIHFSIPKDNPSEKDMNQGTLVVFNLDPSVSNDDIRQIFGVYGEVKEIRETPHKRHHKFIEFYDVRAAEAALRALNRSDIAGKRIKLEPSRPGGARRNLMQQLSQELERDEAQSFLQQLGSPVANSPPGAWGHFGSPVEHNALHGFQKIPSQGAPSPVNTNHVSGLASILPLHLSSSPKIAPIGKDQGRGSHASPIFSSSGSVHSSNYQQVNSFPEHKLTTSSGPVSANSSGIGTLSGPQFLWGSPTIYPERSVWPKSSAGHTISSSRQGFPYTSQQGSFVGAHQHYVGSAPSGIPLEKHFGYFPESPESSYMSTVGFGGMGGNRNSGSYMTNIGSRVPIDRGIVFPRNLSENGSPNFRMMSVPRHGPVFPGGSFPGPGTPSNEGFFERSRIRRLDTNGDQTDNKKQYQLDLDKITSGEDIRTTLMIKNIPNKYTSKMLLAAIDENHQATYDFLYLPIDFKNKCNVGYAFINMVSPMHIISFYKSFNGKRWEKFNSEKVASLAYARIQGKASLVSHFQNSSLMNEDKRCRPILFHSEGQEAYDQEHLRTGNLNICVRQPDGSYIGDSFDIPEENPD